MRTRLLFAILFSTLNLFASTTNISAQTRFTDFETGHPVQGLNHVWEAVQPFYGEIFPKVIRIKFHNDTFSGFEFPDIMWLGNFSRNPNDRTKRFYEVVRHELSHLGNMHLTNSMSMENRFRFFDEGFAMFFEFPQKQEWLFQKSFKIARKYLARGKVSFAQVQDWKSYFGDPLGGSRNELDKNAYNIGATFVFFLINNYGKENFRNFLVAIGDTKDLELSLIRTYGISKEMAEKSWLDYILKQ